MDRKQAERELIAEFSSGALDDVKKADEYTERAIGSLKFLRDMFDDDSDAYATVNNIMEELKNGREWIEAVIEKMEEK